MSLEKLYSENQEKEKEKKEKEKSTLFFEEQKILRESTNLLHELALKISLEFGIDISQVKDLIRSNTLGDLEGLKNTIGKNINIQDFERAIQYAREKISDMSKKNREKLKEILLQENGPESYKYQITEKYFLKYRQKALSPQSIGDQCIGAGLGIIDTTEAVILFIYNLGKGILFTPYHIYLILTGKAEYNTWKNI